MSEITRLNLREEKVSEALADNDSEVLVARAVEVNRKMWQSRHELDQVRLSKKTEELNDQERQQYDLIRNEWRSNRDELVQLLQELPDDLASKIELTPPRVNAEESKAEAGEKRIEEIKTALAKLYHDIWNRKQELEDVSTNFKRAKDTAKIIESAGLEADETRLKGEIKDLEREKKELEKELAKLEKGVGKPFKDRFKEAHEKSKKLTFFDEEESKEKTKKEPSVAITETLKPVETPKESSEGAEPTQEAQPEKQEKSNKKFSLWKWTKERVKTFFKDGGLFGEFVQAETMRKGTGQAASSTEALSTLVKTEWNVENPDAVQDIVNEALKVEKKTGLRMDNLEFGTLLNQISKDRKESNDDEKAYIIRDAIDNLKINLVKARGQATSETVLSPENLVQVEAEMRTELNKLSDAALVKDVKGFAKVMRDNLDKYWWLRYMYGGAELAALAGLGYYALSGGQEAISLPNVARPKFPMPEGLKPIEASDDVRLMLDHYWGVAKRLLGEHGISSPTDGQIMDVTKVLAKDNNVAVPPWGIEGEQLHTKLPVHWVLIKGAATFILRNYIGTP